MMDQVFIDTSAFYALMDGSDQYHQQAGQHWQKMVEEGVQLSTNNYIIVESLALLKSRLGFEAAELWYRDILGVVDLLWVEGPAHQMAYELWLSLGRRNLSLVDCVSFVSMRSNKIETFFGFDKHFIEQGFVPFNTH